MDSYELNRIGPDDIVDIVIPKIEESFGFKFGVRELEPIRTYGELCDIILDKIQLIDANDCTTQQAFYKLRDSIAKTLNIDKKNIAPQTTLTEILPVGHLRQSIKMIEKNLGFSLKILRPPHSISWTLAIILIVSLLGLFYSWQLASVGISLSVLGLIVANKFPNRTDYKIVSELAEKMTRENYLKARRNHATVNRNEILKQIEELFVHEVQAKRESLKRESSFI